MTRKIFILVIGILLTACQVSPTFTPTIAPTNIPTLSPILTPTAIPTPIPTPTTIPFPKDYKQTFKVGEYNLTLECKGQGEPTIILEDGYAYKSWPSESLYRFTHLGRTCTYARPGTNGEKVTHLRTTQDQVQDLHDLLTQAGVPGPFILVGHSIAAFNILMYTDQYPQDVVGLVCVDCRAPLFTSLVLEKYGPEQPDDPAGVKDTRKVFTQVSGDEYENMDVPTSQAQVLKVTSLGDRPFVVLLNPVAPWSDGSEKFDKLLNEAWNEASIALSKLSSHSRLEIVQNCDHFSILYSSRVDFAVEEVYMEVK